MSAITSNIVSNLSSSIITLFQLKGHCKENQYVNNMKAKLCTFYWSSLQDSKVSK